MTIKFIKRQAQKAAVLSFKAEKLDEVVARKFLKEFRKLPLNEAIMNISFYLKALKAQINRHVLTIESASRLSVNDEKSIIKALDSEFRIFQTQTKLSPSLLGGFKVKIADTVLDLSLKQKLEQLSTAITN